MVPTWAGDCRSPLRPFCGGMLAAVLLAFSQAPAWAQEDAAQENTRETVRQELEQSGDPALIAQRTYFPHHFEKVLTLLVRMRGEDHLDALEAQGQLQKFSARNWNQYSKWVRRADPEDWKLLLQIRSELFDLINRTHGPRLCYEYDHGGAQVLVQADPDRYHEPVGSYISTFMEVAARGRERSEPQENETRYSDLSLLYETAAEDSGDPSFAAILRPGPLLHSQFCAAMVQVMKTALSLEPPEGPRVWRYLITQPAGVR